MLRTVSVPVAELATVKPTHVHVLLGLLSFADRTGRCWPSLRRLAAVCGMTLSRVQRALVEMEKAGHLTRRRRFGASCVYRITSRFLPGWVTKNLVPSEKEVSNESRQRERCSASRTESEAKKEIPDLKIKGGEVRRDAPPTRHRYQSQHAPEAAAAAAYGPNPFARRRWLENVNRFIGERLSGAAQWGGWELVSKALNGDSLAPDERRALNRLSDQMRTCGYRTAA